MKAIIFEGIRKVKSLLPLLCANGIALGAIAACSFSPTSNDVSSAQTTSSPAPQTSPQASPPGKIAAVSFLKTTVLNGLEHPWSMAWLPDGAMLITERPGRLRIVRNGVLDPTPIAGVPTVLAFNQGGLMDVSLHPRFAENRLVYLTYSHGTRNANRTRVARATFDGKSLQNVQVIFEVSQTKSDGQHFGSRILWLPDGTMLVAIGDGGNPPVELNGDLIRKQAQNLRSHLGKIVRLNDDGSVPRNNPFAANKNADPAIWSYGHRNIQGLAFDPTANRVWSTEHGARGGDELNLVQPGKNYGWPLVTYSKEYFGPEISNERSRPGLIDPKTVWTPAKAPSGLAFYTGDRFPQWQGNLFAGGLVSRDVKRISLDASGKVVSQQQITIGQRVRDVRQGPDGLLYILTDEPNGQLIRLEPS
ncbi:MAG: PQQ-dependent sugar dehydrogenase [Oscillatoriales cyanobacterium C42_A2020_001]|nr:PQQ-dependent sugar dehydrogenase [Leptolyngbyaceae cyanobacterium C42_A2020_001]